MAGKFNFTDEQWYNFICGFCAGLRMKDLDGPEFETNISLQPIGVGGRGKIGLELPNMEYDENNREVSIPVYTHDVDIGYSGFSVNINLDSRLSFRGVEEGDFGTIGLPNTQSDIRYTFSNGQLKAIGLRQNDIVFNASIILFYIKVRIVTPPTLGNAINLDFNNNSFTNTNYTTLIKWVKLEDGKWYNFYITPLLNVNGGISSNIVEPYKKPLGDGAEIREPGAPTGIYIGSSFTAPSSRGVVPIVSCSNVYDNFPYNGVHCKMIVRDKDAIFNYLNVVGLEGFSINTVIDRNEEGFITIEILASRSEKKIDSVTFCYVEYVMGNRPDKYDIQLENILSELSN